VNTSRGRVAARRRIVVVTAATLLVVAMAAGVAGASATVAPATWTARVCTALDQWHTRVVAVAPRAASADPVVARASLSGSLGESVVATDDLVRAMRAAGVPKVAHGREIAASLVATFTRVRTQLAATARRAQGLPTTDPAAFATGATAVERALERTMSSVYTALAKAGNKFPSKTLDRAFARTAACAGE
jgi:hypothetical protein